MKELRDTRKQDVKPQTNLMKSIDKLTNQVADLTTQNKTLQQKVNDLLSQISVGNKVRFGSTSQKGTKKKAAPVQDREKDKDDFDGTNGATMSSTSQTDTSSADANPESAEQTQKSFEYRKGMKYQTMFADNRIVHESDVNLLPEGATVIKSVYESTYEQVSYIVQHDYEMIIYKDKDGVMRKGYFPKAEESAEIDRIPGTHASCSLLANLVFNKYHMNTPVYREMVRLLNNKMNVSRNTVYNWFRKGSDHLKKVLPVLKEKLLAKGAVVNCDETISYHTFIERCKMCGFQRWNILRNSSRLRLSENKRKSCFLLVEREQSQYKIKAIMQGRTDYERSSSAGLLPTGRENLLPMTIGIKK